MLDTEQIKKNYERFVKGAQKYGFYSDKLIELLGAEFIKAPASTMRDRHNAFEGGLCDHILRVAETALRINKSLADSLKMGEASIIKVAFLHQIGKAHMYKPCESEWHRTNLGKMYEYVDADSPVSTGEASIYIINQAGISLTKDEYQAILNYSKPLSDAQANYHTCNLGELLSQAIEWASREERLIQKSK